MQPAKDTNTENIALLCWQMDLTNLLLHIANDSLTKHCTFQQCLYQGTHFLPVSQSVILV